MDYKILNLLLKEKGLSAKDLAKKLVSNGYFFRFDHLKEMIDGRRRVEKDFSDAVSNVLSDTPAPRLKPAIGCEGINEELDALIAAHKLTNEEVARRLSSIGVTVKGGTISSYRTNRRKAKQELLDAVKVVLGEKVKQMPLRSIKVSGAVSCGKPCENVYQDVEYIPIQSFKDSLVAVRACGDSMESEISDGDILVIDTDKDVRVVSGEIVVYRLHGDEACKVFISKPEAGIIELKPINASPEFKTLTLRVECDDIESLSMFKVVEVHKTLKNTAKARLRRMNEL